MSSHASLDCINPQNLLFQCFFTYNLLYFSQRARFQPLSSCLSQLVVVHFTLKQLLWHKCWHQSDLRQCFTLFGCLFILQMQKKGEKKVAKTQSANICKSTTNILIQKTKSWSNLLDLLRQGKCVCFYESGCFCKPAHQRLTAMRLHAKFNSFICFQTIIWSFNEFPFPPLMSGHHFHHRLGHVWRGERRERHWRTAETSLYVCWAMATCCITPLKMCFSRENILLIH